MKTLLFLLAWAVPAWLVTAGDTAPLPTRTPDAPVPPNEFVRFKQANRDKDFPMLAYWGVGGLEWGSLHRALQVAGSSQAKPPTVGQDGFVSELQFDKKTDRLAAVTYEAKPWPATDQARQAEFERVYQFLISLYHEPSSLRLDRRGTRARNPAGHANQTGTLFLADWNGTATVLTLDFADDHLFIHFAPAPSFNPATIQELLRNRSGVSAR